MCALNYGFKHIVQIMEHLGVWLGKNLVKAMERLEPYHLQKVEKKAQDLQKNLDTRALKRKRLKDV